MECYNPSGFQGLVIPEKLEELERGDYSKDDESDSANEYLFDCKTQSDSDDD